MARPIELTVEDAIADLQAYLAGKGFSMGGEVLELFRTAEHLGYEHNRDLYEWVFLAAILKCDSEFRSVLMRNDCDADAAFQLCVNEMRLRDDDKYDVNLPPYSASDSRLGGRELTADWCMTLASKRNSHEVTRDDFILALFAQHDEWSPPLGNHDWTDERLRVPYNTLSHVIGHYERDLWLSFDDVKAGLNLQTGSETRKGLVESAPKHVRSSLLDLLGDHPNHQKNCFLIMPFCESPFHIAVRAAITDLLHRYGFEVLRADDRAYSNDVFSNIETYMCGCRFGIAVHERAKTDDHNVNVALELGYMRGQGKHVCLLKEKTVKALTSDLQGQLYVEFDSDSIELSIANALARWMKDRRLIKA